MGERIPIESEESMALPILGLCVPPASLVHRCEISSQVRKIDILACRLLGVS